MPDVQHRTLEDTKVKYRTVSPTAAPLFDGEAYFENSPGDGGDIPPSRCVRVGSGSNYVIVAFIPMAYDGDPTGIVVSRCAMDMLIDTTNDYLYYASSAGSTTWYLINSGGGGGS